MNSRMARNAHANGDEPGDVKRDEHRIVRSSMLDTTTGLQRSDVARGINQLRNALQGDEREDRVRWDRVHVAQGIMRPLR
jgi:hypothetical protein